jgi:ubiquinone/menaquinone biosynthesis C-methylase UbiE
LPASGKCAETGVASGIFAAALGIREGCDPSATMMKMAHKRDTNAITAVAESLPYGDSVFGYALMVTAICFVDDARTTMYDIRKVPKNGVLQHCRYL